MALLTTEALVLRGYKLGETSKVVVLLTRERGKVRAVARGARGGRPRYQSALEPLSEVRVGLYGRQGAELLRLGPCELLRSAFRAGERGLETALNLSYFAELLDAFAQEGEAEDDVYRLALAVVRAAEGGTDTAVLARYLEAWLLKLHGVYPPLDHCASCGAAL
ncbi:MAG TPA: DNA repair protein RecO, partial [Vicinamibacteria bacterium]|nr:DNA repair protein RecO [Vicinamibacteria bacterium]